MGVISDMWGELVEHFTDLMPQILVSLMADGRQRKMSALSNSLRIFQSEPRRICKGRNFRYIVLVS